MGSGRKGTAGAGRAARAKDAVVTLTGMDRSGAAVALLDGERLIVHGGIPGERVRIRPSRALAHSTLADLEEVLDPSPHRVSPRCPHASLCGGCAWQHVSYQEQLRLKERLVETLLQRTLGRRTPPVLPAIGTPAEAGGTPWAFRQKAAFVFGPGKGGERLAMGHFARGTHLVVPVAECPVHGERANRVAFALRDELRRAGIAPAGPDLRGLLRHVVVRTTRDESEAVAVLVATRPDAALERPLRALLERPERPEGLALNLHDRPGPYLLGRETRRVDGPGHVKETSLGATFLVPATSFFQTNVAAASVLVRLVTEACERGGGEARDRVLDLYSGGGLFSLPLARRGHRVTAVEESRKASRDAELNRRVNGVAAERLRLVSAAVEPALQRFDPAGFGVVILDPPREGASPQVTREVFRRLRPRRAILVSCNPDALARDLPVAMDAGYRVLSVQPVDMFPHTAHVEVVAVLAAGSRSGAQFGG